MYSQANIFKHEYFETTDQKLLEKFAKFHGDNHDLWKLMERFALQAKKSGRKRFSIWMIANRVRWYTQVETTGKDFKLSNDYLAVYARLLMIVHPQLDGLFSIKTMKKHRTAARD